MKRRNFLIQPFIAGIRLYRNYLSPLKGRPTCRFYPTCSRYAITALEEWGLIRGGILAVWRILRCNPFGRGGYDPVPPGSGYPRRSRRSRFISPPRRQILTAVCQKEPSDVRSHRH